ncbi:hypothetical protein DSM104299_04595 [Baekduia alba]|nr:hypothetical protein DSM104299_04595 [Baekduia alba]
MGVLAPELILAPAFVVGAALVAVLTEPAIAGGESIGSRTYSP